MELLPNPIVGFGPFLAALVVLAVTEGKSGVVGLLRRMVRWRVGLQWYAAAHGLPIAKIVLHDPPLRARWRRGGATDLAGVRREPQGHPGRGPPWRRGRTVHDDSGYAAGDDRRDPPQPCVGGIGGDGPHARLRLGGHGHIGRDGTIPVEVASRVTVPALVLTGGADYPWMTDVGRRLAEAMPNGQHRVLEGQEHTVSPEVLVPVLAEFFAD